MTFELGIWHHEQGHYRQWKEDRIREFKIYYELISIDPCITTTGSVLLLAEGKKRETND